MSTADLGPRRADGLSILLGSLVLVTVLVMSAIRAGADGPTVPVALNAWLAVMVGLVVQAVPFLVLGVALSAAIAALLPAGLVSRLLPREPVLAVPVAGAAGLVLPGCECASVPVSDALMRRGMSPAAAFTFLLAAPAINPIVLVATAVAFPTVPLMPWARLAASFLAAVLMGWLWVGAGKESWLKGDSHSHAHDGDSKAEQFRAAFTHDFVHAGGYLVLGAMVAAALNVFAPADWIQAVADHPVGAILGMALLAVVVAICSEADAFVAAAMVQFSPTAQLAFMVVSPMVDVKLMAMQRGTFGRGFMWRFAPVTFVVAVLCAWGIGSVML